MKFNFASIFTIIILLITSGCATTGNSQRTAIKPNTNNASINAEYPRSSTTKKNISWDQQVGEKYYEEQLEAFRKNKVKVNNDSQMTSRLRLILNKLKRESLIPELNYTLNYVDHETVNASCYPGGKVLVYRGLFDKKNGLVNPNNDDEIAAVLAHEISHATLRHSYLKYQKAQTASLFGGIASVVIGGAAGNSWKEMFNTVFEISAGLYFPSYSRKQETEADIEGLYTMIKAGYKPESAIAVWERAAKQHGNKTSIYASHPANNSRADTLKQALTYIRKKQ